MLGCAEGSTMHSIIYNEFREIIRALEVKGRVLEVGAVPSEISLLAMDILQAEDRVGLNIQGNVEFGGFTIVEANGNDMSMFPTGHFDCVLSNATLEHDPFFWKTCAEMRRVLRVGGAAVIGAPAFTVESGVADMGLQPVLAEDDWNSWRNCSLTFRYHGAPMDYYRFSPSAFSDVIFEGYRDVTIKSVMMPPRIIAYGFKI
jgi:SAM-dependent methyltransferase